MLECEAAAANACPTAATPHPLPPAPPPLQSSQRPASLESNSSAVDEAAVEGQPEMQQKKQKQQAQPELTEAIKRRCEGTLGTWRVDYHTQLPGPAETAPRGIKTCSLNCNKVCEQRAAWFPCPASMRCMRSSCALCSTRRPLSLTSAPTLSTAAAAGRHLQRPQRPVHLPRGLAGVQLPAPHESVLRAVPPAVRV
jgi:hypothetical protein